MVRKHVGTHDARSNRRIGLDDPLGGRNIGCLEDNDSYGSFVVVRSATNMKHGSPFRQVQQMLKVL